MEAASLSSQKTAIRLFVAKYAALTFIATRICFGFLATKLGFFEAYITKKRRFSFFWERRCNQLYSTTPYFGLFAVKLCCWQRYFIGKRFSSSLQRVTLVFAWFYSKQRFCMCLAKLRCFQHHLSENNVFFFRYQTTLVNYAAFSLITPKTCFCLLATKLGCFELYVACSLLKYVVLSFIAPKTCFASLPSNWAFSIKLQR